MTSSLATPSRPKSGCSRSVNCSFCGIILHAIYFNIYYAQPNIRWAMKYLLALIVSWSFVTSCICADNLGNTICIQVGDSSSPEPIYVNNKRQDIESARGFLSSVKFTFGGNDSVLLICRRDTPIGLILDLRSMITVTHKNLYIVVADNRTTISSQMMFQPPSNKALKLLFVISSVHNTLWDDVLRKNE